MATHSSTPAWEILWTEEPGGLQSMGSQSWTRNAFHFLFCRGQQNALLADWKDLNKSPEFLLSPESKHLLSLHRFSSSCWHADRTAGAPQPQPLTSRLFSQVRKQPDNLFKPEFPFLAALLL